MNCKIKSFMTKRKAFTLIELLIVIAIIGILFIVLVSKVDFATDKAKATGVQTDFRSFQVAFDTVAKENAGFNTFGWDTGDANQDGIRNSYDEGDNGAGGGIAKDGIQNGTEVFTGHKVYAETFTKVYSLKKNGTGSYDREALNRLETAINANLDPKLHITIKDDGEIVMANGAKDPWNKEYHGWYITNAEVDKKDRGAIVMYSDGANNEFGSEHEIENGVVTVSVPGSNKAGKDDYSIVSLYTYVNGYGEVKNITTGFSNNQTMMGGSGSNLGGGAVVTPPTPIDYEIIDGANETFTQNETTLEFRSNADYNKFVEVKVDGSVVDPSNYTVTEGSTIVTFTKTFFDSLGEGEHTVEIISEDGVAEAEFEVAKPTLPAENPSGTVNSYSWSELKLLAQAKMSAADLKSKYGIKVGDYKEVNGVKYILVDIDGNDYDGFVFMYNTKTNMQMNTSLTNAGGYGAYAMGQVEALYNSMDTNLKSSIKAVNIKYNEGNANYSTTPYHITTEPVHLFLASYKEVGLTSSLTGTYADGYNAEGTCFDLFTDDNSSRTAFMSTANISDGWWLRSAYSTNTTYFYSVDKDGNSDIVKARNTSAVVPVFVIGGQTPSVVVPTPGDSIDPQPGDGTDSLPTPNLNGTVANSVSPIAYSWSELKALAQANLGADALRDTYGIEVGDYKEVNGVKYVLVDLDGNSYDGFVFMYNTGVNSSMNSSLKTGGYAASAMKDKVNELYEALATSNSDLYNVIKKVDIGCYSGSSTTTLNVGLFLPSMDELGASTSGREGSVFDATDIEKAGAGWLSPIYVELCSSEWWTRSVLLGKDTSFFRTCDPEYGGFSNYNPTSSKSIVACFVIG